MEKINAEVVDTVDDLGDEPEQENLDYDLGVAQEEENTDYATLSKEELVALAEKAAATDDLKEASEVVRNIRPILDSIFKKLCCFYVSIFT